MSAAQLLADAAAAMLDEAHDPPHAFWEHLAELLESEAQWATEVGDRYPDAAHCLRISRAYLGTDAVAP